MKSQIILKTALVTLVFVILGANVYAQATGKISGIVSDQKTGETLIGVSVKIAGTTKGVGTDVEGRYTIGGLATGKYALQISYVGYSPKNVTEIEVKEGSTTTVNIVLEESSSQTLNQVVITSTAKQESVNSLYLKQKTNISIFLSY